MNESIFHFYFSQLLKILAEFISLPDISVKEKKIHWQDTCFFLNSVE